MAELLGASPLRAGYVAVFGLVALASFVGAARARRVRDRDTRRGLVALLLTSGAWAATHAGVLVVPPDLAPAVYLLGLVFGFTTVWEWLYFCSAYTGRGLHRDPTLRRLGVGVLAAVVAVKLANPIHGQYFRTTFVRQPFPHIAIRQGFLHWTVTGFSYALAAVGLFMLFDLFRGADYDTAGLAALVGATGLPVVLDLLGYAAANLIDIIYAPVGVVVFALGVLFLFEDRFLAVQLTSGVDDPVLFLDREDRVRDFNDRLLAVLPALEGARDEPLSAVAPALAECLDGDERLLELADGTETRYYLVSESPVSLESRVGRVVVLSDVTETERQRRELRRHNDQLEGFAEAVTHELRNAVQLAGGHVSMAAEELEGGDADAAGERLRSVRETVERMARVVEDLSTLARYSQTVDTTSGVDLREAAETAWERADTAGMTLRVATDASLRAAPSRLEELLASAFRFAAHNGAGEVTLSVEGGNLLITDDGDTPDPDAAEAYFDYGEAVPDAEAGMALPNVRMLARVQDWSATLDTDYADGTRVVIGGVDLDAD